MPEAGASFIFQPHLNRYFSFVTGLTIDYGDIVAKTQIARLISVYLGLIGIEFTGLMVATAINADSESKEGYEELYNSKR